MMESIRELSRLLGELRRRQVVRVAVAYLVVGWAMVEVAKTITEVLDLPTWTPQLVLVLMVLGFPLAMVFAWAFDITPEGVRRTPDHPVEEGEATAASATVGGVPVRRIFPSVRPNPRIVPAAREEEVSLRAADPMEIRRAALAKLRHDVRTALNHILGYSEMVLEDGESELPRERAAELRRVHAAGKQLLAQTEELLRTSSGDDALDEEELARLKAEARSSLLGPAQALLDDCRGILERARALGDAELAPDFARVVEAAVRLSEIVEGIGVAEQDSPEPAVEPDAPGREATERVFARLRSGGPVEAAPPRHGHLLVVDDDALNRDLLSRQLARQGFSVTTAADGFEALRMLRAHTFDLVLLDVLMPRMDGVQVLERMRQEAALVEIPVIMISALDDMEGVVRCIEKGAIDYLAKPFDPVLLRARIGTTLEIHQLRERERRASESLHTALQGTSRLARSLFPGSVAERVLQGVTEIAELHPDVTAVSLELEGLGTLAARLGAERAVDRAKRAVAAIDRIASALPVESQWVGGVRFVALAGVSGVGEDHAEIAAELALRLAKAVAGWENDPEPLRAGIGIHTGAAAGGVATGERLVFGWWGEAVDVAHELGRTAPVGTVQVSPATYARLYSSFELESGGVLQVAEHSHMPVYRLRGRKAAFSSR